MHRWKRITVITSIALSTLCLTGCWDYQKINDRGPIIGVAVDPVEGNPTKFTYTLQVPVFSPGAGAGSSGGESGQGQAASTKKFRNFSIQAEGLSEAMTKAQMQYDKMLYLGNLQTVVLNKDLTYGQIRHVVTEMVRIPALDKLAWVVFADTTAREIFETKEEEAPADTLDRFFGANLKQHGYTTRTRLWEFWRDLQGAGIDPHTGLVKTTRDGLQVFGCTAYTQSGAKIELPPEDTLYYNFLENKVERISIWIPAGASRFELGEIRSQSELSTTLNGTRPQLHVRIRVRSVLHQDETSDQQDVTTTELARFEAQAERYVQDHVKTTLKRFQDQRIDAFGFGSYLMTHQPSTYALVLHRWPEQFSSAIPEVRVKVTLLRKGSLM